MTDGKVKKTKKREQKVEDGSPIASPKPKPVKQEEPKQEDDGDDHPLPLSKPKKSTLGDPREKDPKTQKKEAEKGDAKPSKATREEPHDSEQDDGKPNKEKRKMKIRKKSVKKKTVVKGKKAYDLPGQKHDTPDERDPLRIFYEMLYRQLPDSELATVWMMEWGLLPPDEAKKVYEKKLKNRQQKLESPVRVVAVKKKSEVSVKKSEMAVKSISKTKKRKVKHGTLDEDENSSISPKKTNKKHKLST